MKIIHENSVTVYENYFSDQDILAIQQFSKNVFDNELSSLDHSKRSFQQSLTQGVKGTTMIYDIHPDLDFEIYDILTEKFDMFAHYDFSASLFFAEHGGGINWHNDAGHKAALTVYLNKNWKPEYGGFFTCETHKEKLYNSFCPEFNLAIYQEGGIRHAVLPTYEHAPIRVSLQVFFR